MKEVCDSWLGKEDQKEGSIDHDSLSFRVILCYTEFRCTFVTHGFSAVKRGEAMIG